jgi:hypothetical protein
MLIVRDLDRQRFIEAPVDIQIGVLAVGTELSLGPTPEP